MNLEDYQIWKLTDSVAGSFPLTRVRPGISSVYPPEEEEQLFFERTGSSSSSTGCRAMLASKGQLIDRFFVILLDHHEH